MRFIDERKMWYADTEKLAKLLANKSAQDVQEILGRYDVIRLGSRDRERISTFGRLLSLILFPFLLFLMGIKWLLTGDKYLDSWVKKNKLFSDILKFCGFMQHDA